MEFSFKLAKEIDPIAVFALVLALLQTLASLMRWWSGRKKIKFKAFPNMIMIGNGYDKEKVYISIRVTNIGDKPISLRSITGKYWPSALHKIFKLNQKNFYVNAMNYLGQESVPAIIEIGKDWDGFMIQDADVNKMLEGYLQLEANYSLSEKSMCIRVKGRKTAKE